MLRQCLIRRFAIGLRLGIIIRFFASGGSGARFNRPPTLMRPSSRNGSNFHNELDFLTNLFPSLLRVPTSSLKDSFCKHFRISFSAIFISLTVINSSYECSSRSAFFSTSSEKSCLTTYAPCNKFL